MGAQRFQPSYSPHTYHATTDDRKTIEVTHLGVGTSIQIHIPYIVESDLADIKSLIAALTICNTVVINDIESVLPEFDWPITCHRNPDSIPTLQRISTCNAWTLTLDLIRIN